MKNPKVTLAVQTAAKASLPVIKSLSISTTLWQSATNVVQPTGDAQLHVVNPAKFATFTLTGTALRGTLAGAPMEFTLDAATPLTFSLPQPDGTYARFAVVEAPIMEAGLAAQFPDIKTYRGQGIDDPTATLRMDYTPQGFHAQVLTGEGGGSWYIDPYQTNVPIDGGTYVSYFQADLPVPTDGPSASGEFAASTPDTAARTTLRAVSQPGGSSQLEVSSRTQSGGTLSLTSGAQLRTYRAAVAADGEYTTFHGGTVAGAQAAIVTTINRVTGIYEKEVACRLVLIANNTSLIFTNAATDPYTNNDTSVLMTQNQSTVDTIIGDANYDIGHVFTTGSGGVAGLGVVCVTGSKARGTTGSFSPVGDSFDVGLVAHEVGHQFGGSHTFNGVNGSAAGNVSPATAMEPGSGSTIQAYAGICGVDNLQSQSDPYFHSVSLDQIITYTTTGAGNAVTATATGNTAPTVDAGVDVAIPTGTPFALNATGSDANGDTLTYCWEERDTGAAQALTEADNGVSPLFRSWLPTTNSTRTFPRLAELLTNTLPIGEKLPSLARTMKFRVVARDNRALGGGIGTDDLVINVVNTGAPFLVTTPNTAISWAAGSTQTVTWDVAGTRNAPISAAQVNIKLSTDGGNTFPITLAAGTPNDGSQSINLPVGLTSTTARIKVEAVGNVFFDLSNTNFTLTAGTIAADRFEANGSLAAATDLGTTFARTENQLSIHAAGDEDFFKFSATNAGSFTVGLAFTNSQGNVDLSVFDVNGTLVGSSTTTGDTEQVTFTASKWQTFYVKATGVAGSTNPNYGLTITGPSPVVIAADRFEPSDSFATAWDLGNLGSRTETGLTVHLSNNDDYFKFKGAANGSTTVSLSYTNSQGNVDLFVYNASQTLIGSSTTTNNTESVTFTATSGTQYFIKVAGASGATNPSYSLSVAGPAGTGDRFEPNDSFAAAYDLAGTPDRTETGLSVHAAANDDYFKITPVVGGTMTISMAFTHAQGDLDLFLYDSAQTQLAKSDSSNNSESVSATVTAGSTFFFKITGFNNATNPAYSLTVDVPDVPPSTNVLVTGPQFFASPNPPYLRYGFSQDVAASLALADLTVQNLSAGGTVTPASLTYDLGSNVATVTFASALAAGNYRATLTAAGVTNSIGSPLTSNSVFDFTVSGGAATVAGLVFQDSDSSGARNGAEPIVAGATVFIDTNLDGSFTTGEPTTTSAVDGTYSFTGLTAGSTYRVRVTPPAGFIAIGPAAAGIDAVAPASTVNLGLFPVSYSAPGDYTLRLDGAGTNIQVLLGGVLQFSVPKNSPITLSFVPNAAGTDSLTVDLTNGDPIPASGAIFNGGAGTNTVSVIGTASADTFVLSASTLAVNGKGVNFAAGTTAINVSGGVGNDSLTVNAVPAASVSFNGGLTASDQDLLTINAGVYKLLADPSASTAHLTIANNASLDLGGLSATIAALTGNGSVTNTSAAAAATLNIAGGSTLAGVANGAGTFGGVIGNGAGGVSLTKSGTGTFTLTATQTYTVSTTVTGGTLDASAGSITSSTGPMSITNAGSQLIARQIAPSTLTVGSGATLRLTNVDTTANLTGRSSVGTLSNSGLINVGGTGLVVGTAGLTSATIVAQIQSGRGTGNWLGGSGITSSSAAADPTRRAVGFRLSGSLWTIAQTTLGDATLDGITNIDDLSALAQNYNQTAKLWQNGDYNYDGTVNVDDLSILAQNYNLTIG